MEEPQSRRFEAAIAAVFGFSFFSAGLSEPDLWTAVVYAVSCEKEKKEAHNKTAQA